MPKTKPLTAECIEANFKEDLQALLQDTRTGKKLKKPVTIEGYTLNQSTWKKNNNINPFTKHYFFSTSLKKRDKLISGLLTILKQYEKKSGLFEKIREYVHFHKKNMESDSRHLLFEEIGSLISDYKRKFSSIHSPDSEKALRAKKTNVSCNAPK